jgi:ABC-type transport system involved in multi-copper enzyme maturation permease subunit
MLSFFAALGGPIFAKEMVEIARRKRYYFNRVFLGLVLLLTLYLTYQANSWRLSGASGESIRAMAALSEAMFMAAGYVQYLAVYLFVPLFVCGVVASEREEKTLDLLFTTDLKDREIVLGKLLSRLAALVALIVCAMPITSLITLLGGIDPLWIWRVLSATLLATIFTGAHAIYFSVITKSPMGALVRTYFWMGLLFVGLPLAGMMIAASIASARRNWEIMSWYSGTVAFLHPLGTFVTGLHGDVHNDMQRALSIRGWPTLASWFFSLMFILPLLWSLLLIWRATRRLRLPPSLFGNAIRRLPPIRAFLEWRDRRSDRRREVRHRSGAHRRWLGMPIRNPLWLRSRLARVYDREGHIGRLQWAAWGVAFAFLILTIVASDGRALKEDESSMAFQSCAWICIVLLAVILAGMSLAADRRRGFLEQVLVTPISAQEIVDGTIMAVWQHLKRSYWLLPLLALCFLPGHASTLAGTLASLFTGTLFLLFLIVHGVGCSLGARSIPGALVPTVALPVVTCIATAIMIGIFEEAHGPVFWVAGAVFLAIAWFWVRHRPSAPAVGCFFIAVHLTLAAVLTCWLFDGRRSELPLLAINPAFLTIGLLDKMPLDRSFRGWGHRAVISLPLYWLSLVLSIAWARWWLIHNLDRLTDRTRQKPVVVEWLEEVPA